MPQDKAEIPLDDNDRDHPGWARVYIFVIAFTVAVITALGAFSAYFS